MFAYKIAYSNRKNSNEKYYELFGKFSGRTMSFIKLSSQFENKIIRNLNKAGSYMYSTESLALAGLSQLNHYISSVNLDDPDYTCSYELVEVTAKNYKEFNFPTLSCFKKEEVSGSSFDVLYGKLTNK